MKAFLHKPESQECVFNFLKSKGFKEINYYCLKSALQFLLFTYALQILTASLQTLVVLHVPLHSVATEGVMHIW